MKITFIGLGLMGSRMAANLLKNEVDLTVYNRSKGAIEKLIRLGAKTAESANAAVENAEIVFSMLSTPEVVEQVFMKSGGVLMSMKQNAIWVDCSTVNPSFTIRAKEAANQAGVRFVDAPVAGTLSHAEKAELVFFVGADEQLYKEIEPLLNYMGKKVLNIGETGKGASFKMLVNMMLAQSMIIFSEAVLLGEKMGMDKDFLLNMIPGLVVSAPFTKFKAEMLRSDNYDVQFPLEWMHKDLHLAAVTAFEHKLPLYLVNLAKEIYAEANLQGLGRLDFAAVHHYLEKRRLD